MSDNFEPGGLATAIGSMPHTDPQAACSLVLKLLPDVPAWPQLPRRSFKENMYVQFSEGFPGAVMQGERFHIDRRQDFSAPLEALYAAYIDDSVDSYQIGREYAAGLHAFLEAGARGMLAVKGQVVGPISFGLAVTDQGKRPLLYDDVLADAVAKHLRLKAAWQERALKTLSPRTIIFVDEPYLASVGSAFVSIPPAQMSGLLEEVLQGIGGLKGIHCCANTDWSLILPTSIDILSLDAYGYGESLTLYPAQVKGFLDRGGVIAWGIVPSDEKALARETASSLLDRLENLFGVLVTKGVPHERLVSRCLLTPSCGLATLSAEAATQALELLATVSREMRQRRGR